VEIILVLLLALELELMALVAVAVEVAKICPLTGLLELEPQVAQWESIKLVLVQHLQTQALVVAVLVTMLQALLAMVALVVQVTQQLLIGVNNGTTLRIS
jgi:hypothetical protein